MRRKIIITSAILFLGFTAVAIAFAYRQSRYVKEDAPASVDVSTLLKENSPSTSNVPLGNKVPETVELPEKKALPPELNLAMTFYPQAPFGNWDYPWQESCEEASVLLVANTYLKKNWTRQQFNDEILKLVEWEKERFGSYEHTDMKQTAEILTEYFGLKATLHDSPSYDDVRKMINDGHFVIMPFAGKRLGNPFFSNGGPNYHVLVVKGYKEGEKIITNDVGTKRGENYVYTWKNAWDAFYDYAEPMENGNKRLIEVMP